MTVASQVKQCMYSLKGVQENLVSLSIKTLDEQAQKELYESANILKDVVNDLNKRVGFLEREEPQYRGF